MSSNVTASDFGSVRNGAQKASDSIKEGASRVKRTASSELGNIISDVEELLSKVANVADIDIAQLRQRLQEKIDTARSTVEASGRQVAQSAREAAKVTDEYVHESPWQAIGLAALAGAAIGFAFSRR